MMLSSLGGKRPMAEVCKYCGLTGRILHRLPDGSCAHLPSYCLELLKAEADRIRGQRDQAWNCLQRVEEALGRADVSGLAFILADSHGVDDIAEWNALVDAANAAEAGEE